MAVSDLPQTVTYLAQNKNLLLLAALQSNLVLFPTLQTYAECSRKQDVGQTRDRQGATTTDAMTVRLREVVEELARSRSIRSQAQNLEACSVIKFHSVDIAILVYSYTS